MPDNESEEQNKRKVRIRGQNGFILHVSPSYLKTPPIIQFTLDDTILSHIKWIFDQLRIVIKAEFPDCSTLEQFEVLFMRSEDTEVDLHTWDIIVKSFYTAREYFKKDGEETDCLIFRILLFYIADSLSKEELEREDIKLIIKVYEDIGSTE